MNQKRPLLKSLIEPTYVIVLFILTICLSLTHVAVGESKANKDDKPFFEVTELYEAGRDGYMTYRIPSLAVTRKGTILALCSARFDGHGDWVNIDSMIRRSTDGGKTWTEQAIIMDDGTNLVENPVLIVEPDTDTVHLIFQVNYNHAYHKVSTDEGETWSAPEEITYVFDVFRDRDDYPWTVLAMGPGHGIVMRNGRFVVPLWLSPNHSHRPSLVSTIYSDDRGKTWQAGDIIVNDSEEVPSPSESQLVELSDGRVMSSIRNQSKKYRRLISISPDGATDWSEPEFHEGLYDAICMASLTRMPHPDGKSPDILLYTSPDSSHRDEVVLKWGARSRLNVTIRASFDDGKTWPVSRTIEPDRSGYTDLAVADDGTIYCLFERGGVKEGLGAFAPKHICIAKFNLAWLLDGKDLPTAE